jgi:DNA-binding transcriptional LysR family regulator
LRAFVELAECRSFSTAAKLLHIGQPALSQAVAKLEDIVGVRLLERTTRSVVLTQAGEDFLIDARRVLRENDHLLSHGEEWAHGDRGHLSLLTLPSFAYRILPFILREFGRRHANIKVALYDYRDPLLRQRLAQGEGDLTIMTGPSVLGDLKFLPLLHDDFQILLPLNHILAKSNEISPHQLSNEHLILQRHGMLLRHYVDNIITQLRLKHEPLEVNHVGTVIGMVEAGLGVAVLPSLLCPLPSLQSVVCRPIARSPLSRVVGFVRSTERVALPTVHAFVKVTLEFVTAQNAELPKGVSPIASGAEQVADFLDR